MGRDAGRRALLPPSLALLTPSDPAGTVARWKLEVRRARFCRTSPKRGPHLIPRPCPAGSRSGGGEHQRHLPRVLIIGTFPSTPSVPGARNILREGNVWVINKETITGLRNASRPASCGRPCEVLGRARQPSGRTDGGSRRARPPPGLTFTAPVISRNAKGERFPFCPLHFLLLGHW